MTPRTTQRAGETADTFTDAQGRHYIGGVEASDGQWSALAAAAKRLPPEELRAFIDDIAQANRRPDVLYATPDKLRQWLREGEENAAALRRTIEQQQAENKELALGALRDHVRIEELESALREIGYLDPLHWDRGAPVYHDCRFISARALTPPMKGPSDDE